MADPCPTCGHVPPPPPDPRQGPRFYEARSPVKVDHDTFDLMIGVPTRGLAPIEFQMCNMQLQPLLNARVGYLAQKGKLPAEARNLILEAALQRNGRFVLFLDDDILFPDITVYRLWVTMQKHPEVAALSAVYTTKMDPTEPLIYQDGTGGAFWDWALGGLVPIHSAGAGCVMVNLDYVRKLTPPWFNEAFQGRDQDDGVNQMWGQDRFFMRRLQDEAGGAIYADTGLLLAHFDAATNTVYTIPPDAPCFKRPPVGESFVPYQEADGTYRWHRLIPMGGDDPEFRGYLQWLHDRNAVDRSVVTLL